MIAFITSLIGLPQIGMAIAGILVLFGVRRSGKKAGENAVKADIAKDKAKREKDGQNAVVKEQTETRGLSVRDIVDRMRRR